MIRYLFILFLFLILAYVVFFSPIFKIKAVEVSGNKEVSEEEIKNSFDYGNIFLATQNKVKNNLLKKIPKISDLEIKKNLIKRTLKLLIKERERLGIVCQAGEGLIKHCFYIDEQGIIFEEALQTSGSLILLIKDFSQRDYFLGKKVFEEGIMGFISQVKEDLFSEIGIKSLDFSILSFPIKEIKVMTGEGWYIVFDCQRNTKSQVLALKAALDEKVQDREELEYVDLRIENRIYYK